MTPKELRALFREHTMLSAGENLLLFDDLELYNELTGERKQYTSLEEVANDETLEITPFDTKEGGRGQRSNSGRPTWDRETSSARRVKPNPLPTASFNNQGRFANVDKAVEEFKKRHQHSDIEYGLAIDSQGFVHSYSGGNKGAVLIDLKGGRNMTTIHNHPGKTNSAFSASDLKTFVSSKGERTMIATTTNGKAYKITKRSNFKPKEFAVAVSRVARNTVRDSKAYNTTIDKWLRRNAKKYGYEYEHK